MKNLKYSVIAILLIFLIAELISRAAYVITKPKGQAEGGPESEQPYFMDHPVLGWTARPGYDGPRDFNGRDYHFKINSAFMRDDEISLEKGENTVRVLCLGDSITEGSEVDNDGTYPNLLEKELNKLNLGKHFEIYNCGVGDYGIRQELLFLREIGLKYKPDIVILGYYVNDGRGFIPRKAINPRLPILQFLKKSRFIYYLDKIIMKYRIKLQYKFWDKNRFVWEGPYEEGDWENNKEKLYELIELAGRDWGVAWRDEGWNQVKKNLDTLVNWSEKYNFKLIVLNLPHVVQLYSRDFDDYLYKPQRQLAEYCSQNKIPIIDFIPILKNYPRNSIFTDYCHFKPQGNKIVAEAILKTLLSNQSRLLAIE